MSSPGMGFAALCAIHEKIVIAFDDERRFAKPEHALDGFDKGRLGVLRRGLGRFRGIAENARENLARGIFSEAYRRIEIVNLGETGIRCDPQQILLWNFLEAAAEVARFLFQQPLAHFHGFFALLQIDPMADLAARVRGFGEAKPVAAGRMTFLRQDFNDVAADNLVAESNHLAVDLGADALVTDFGVYVISEIHGRGAARQLQHAPLGRERINFDGGQIDF